MKILRGTIFGGIAYFLLGWLVYGILLMNFMSVNMNQCIARPDGELIWWAIIISNLLLGLLLSIILQWSGAATITNGLKTGALIGLILSLEMDLSSYSMSTLFSNLTTVFVDVLVFTVLAAITGMVIVLTWGK
ncbi:MAG: hypothetical protein EOM73_08815 [Bacteroidia bacterium]|nr:hypothetical protein [Bacteroidia bacterium]